MCFDSYARRMFSQRLELDEFEPIMPTLPLAKSVLQLRPERGRFGYATSPPIEDLITTYRYAFPSLIGAGPYDRRGQILKITSRAAISPIQQTISNARLLLLIQSNDGAYQKRARPGK